MSCVSEYYPGPYRPLFLSVFFQDVLVYNNFYKTFLEYFLRMFLFYDNFYKTFLGYLLGMFLFFNNFCCVFQNILNILSCVFIHVFFHCLYTLVSRCGRVSGILLVSGIPNDSSSIWNQSHLVVLNFCLERLHHVTISHDKFNHPMQIFFMSSQLNVSNFIKDDWCMYSFAQVSSWTPEHSIGS